MADMTANDRKDVKYTSKKLDVLPNLRQQEEHISNPKNRKSETLKIVHGKQKSLSVHFSISAVFNQPMLGFFF